MDFDLTEEQSAIEALARDFAKNELAPHSARWDSECYFPTDVLRKAAGLGFAGLYVREDVGGSALSRLDAALHVREKRREIGAVGVRTSSRGDGVRHDQV